MTSLGDSAALLSPRERAGFSFPPPSAPSPAALASDSPKRTPAARPPFFLLPSPRARSAPEESDRERERETLSKEKKGSFSPLRRPADSPACAFGPAWRQAGRTCWERSRAAAAAAVEKRGEWRGGARRVCHLHPSGLRRGSGGGRFV